MAISKRGRGIYLIRLYYKDEDGVQKRLVETLHGSLEAAQARERELKTLNQQKRLVANPCRSNLSTYLDEWLKGRETELRTRTLGNYAGVIKRYLTPGLGTTSLPDLKPRQIQGFYADLMNGKYSNGRALTRHTVLHCHAVLKLALSTAFRLREIQHNPMDGVKPPKQRRERSKIRSFTPEQARAFLGACQGSRHGVMFEFGLGTGMRPEEYTGLKWTALDLKAGEARVEFALVRPPSGGGWLLEDPKTERSRRTVSLSPSLVEKLKKHRTMQLEERMVALHGTYEDHGFVFTASNGSPIQQKGLHKAFRAILERAKITAPFRPYDLRHTCATLLIADGEPVKVVSERLGHESTAFTQDTYMTVLPHMQKNTASRLEGLLYGP